MPRNNQNFDIELEEIVPEYRSKNKLVRELFNDRVMVAVGYLSRIWLRSPKKLKKIVDIGCGEGILFKKLGAPFPPGLGIDLNDNINSLDDGYNEYKKMDLFDLKGKFDCIVCMDVLEHIEECDEATQKLKSLCDGYLITSEPTESSFYKFARRLIKKKGPCAGEHYFNAKQIDIMIQANGFEKIKSLKLGFLWFPLFEVNLYKVKNDE